MVQRVGSGKLGEPWPRESGGTRSEGAGWQGGGGVSWSMVDTTSFASCAIGWEAVVGIA